MWFIGKEERGDVIAVLYDNENLNGDRGTYTLKIYGEDKKYLDDFNKYTVVQKLSTTRVTIRKSINNNEDFVYFCD